MVVNATEKIANAMRFSVVSGVNSFSYSRISLHAILQYVRVVPVFSDMVVGNTLAFTNFKSGFNEGTATLYPKVNIAS